jgi:hypothetical protein
MPLTNAEQRERDQRQAGTHEYRTTTTSGSATPAQIQTMYDNAAAHLALGYTQPPPAPPPPPATTIAAQMAATPTEFTAPDGTIVRIGAADTPPVPRTYTPLPDTYTPPLAWAMARPLDLNPMSTATAPTALTPTPPAPTSDTRSTPGLTGGGGLLPPPPADASVDPYATPLRLRRPKVGASTNPFIFTDQER